MTAIPNSENMQAAQILNLAINALRNHRQALEVLNDLYRWISAFAPADFEAAPINMNATSAQALFNALTDAHNEWVNNQQGLPATLPATGYQYGASQTALIGPS